MARNEFGSRGRWQQALEFAEPIIWKCINHCPFHQFLVPPFKRFHRGERLAYKLGLSCLKPNHEVVGTRLDIPYSLKKSLECTVNPTSGESPKLHLICGN